MSFEFSESWRWFRVWIYLLLSSISHLSSFSFWVSSRSSVFFSCCLSSSAFVLSLRIKHNNWNNYEIRKEWLRVFWYFGTCPFSSLTPFLQTWSWVALFTCKYSVKRQIANISQFQHVINHPNSKDPENRFVVCNKSHFGLLKTLSSHSRMLVLPILNLLLCHQQYFLSLWGWFSQTCQTLFFFNNNPLSPVPKLRSQQLNLDRVSQLFVDNSALHISLPIHFAFPNRVLGLKWIFPIKQKNKLADVDCEAYCRSSSCIILGQWGWQYLFLTSILRDAISFSLRDKCVSRCLRMFARSATSVSLLWCTSL